MTLTHTYPTGAALFTCPACGRELIMRGVTRIVLVEGDNAACHSYSADGVEMAAEAVDPMLEPFSKWMKARPKR